MEMDAFQHPPFCQKMGLEEEEIKDIYLLLLVYALESPYDETYAKKAPAFK